MFFHDHSIMVARKVILFFEQVATSSAAHPIDVWMPLLLGILCPEGLAFDFDFSHKFTNVLKRFFIQDTSKSSVVY